MFPNYYWPGLALNVVPVDTGIAVIELVANRTTDRVNDYGVIRQSANLAENAAILLRFVYDPDFDNIGKTYTLYINGLTFNSTGYLDDESRHVVDITLHQYDDLLDEDIFPTSNSYEGVLYDETDADNPDRVSRFILNVIETPKP